MRIANLLRTSSGVLAGLAPARAARAAESLPTAYAPPHQYIEDLAVILALVVILAAMALIVYTLISRRGRLLETNSKWMLFIGVGVLPVPAVLLAAGLGLEHSKAVSFCNSCHAMDPFVDDMRNVSSNLMAAAHFKNRYIQKDHCYSCHADYGIFGTMEAKLNGMKHIWGDFSGHWEGPVEISKPYKYRICLNCHAGSVKFESEPEHTGVIEGVMAGEKECSPCHFLAHPSRLDRGAEAYDKAGREGGDS